MDLATTLWVENITDYHWYTSQQVEWLEAPGAVLEKAVKEQESTGDSDENGMYLKCYIHPFHVIKTMMN